MPTEYWTWDENSKINIDKWAQKTLNVISKIVGQPYLEYWKQKNKDLVDTNTELIKHNNELRQLQFSRDFYSRSIFVMRSSASLTLPISQE